MEFQNDNYILIPGFAMREYGLNGNEAILYGLICGFSQDGRSHCEGTIGYYAEGLNVSYNTVKNCITRLIEKGLIEIIEEQRNGVTTTGYRATRFKNCNRIAKIEKPLQKLQSDFKNCNEKDGQYYINNNTNIIDKNILSINNNYYNIIYGVASFVAPEFRDIFAEWLAYKSERKEKYKTERSLRACYTKLLNESHNNPEEARLMIRNAMGNNYAGFFPLKPNEINDARKNKQNNTGVPAEVYNPEWDDSTI